MIDACTHERKELREYVCTDGRKQYVQQCLRCGHRVGGPVPKMRALNGPRLNPFDRELEESWNRAFRLEMDLQRLLRQEQANPEYSDLYREHVGLRSPLWVQLCELVRRRSGGICEACGVRPAVHCHHRTYDHLGNEYLWELADVCLECHARLHPHRDFGVNGNGAD